MGIESFVVNIPLNFAVVYIVPMLSPMVVVDPNQPSTLFTGEQRVDVNHSPCPKLETNLYCMERP